MRLGLHGKVNVSLLKKQRQNTHALNGTNLFKINLKMNTVGREVVALTF